jgi:hypothetical protein
MKTFCLTFCALASLFLFACAHHTLTEEQCTAGNWEGIGLQDGQWGYATGRIALHAKACERFKKTPNQALYLKGWNQGVVSYCQPANGYRVGLDGEDYEQVCPKNLEPAFIAQYNRGIDIYNIRSKYHRMVSDLKSTMREIADDREHLAKAKNEDERLKYTKEINAGEEKKEDLNRRIRVYDMKHSATLADWALSAPRLREI